MKPCKVRIFYPADPAGVVPGGIDTFIRGIIKWAPPELEFSLVGMTTDPRARPVGRWTRCMAGQRAYDFFPVTAVADAGQRGRLPLSLRYTSGAWKYKAEIDTGFDVFDFHRPEPSLLFLADSRPKNAYWHQDPTSIANKASDNLWRRLPSGYLRLEAKAAAQLSSAWCVRESGVQTLRQRYPALGERLRFLPTWVDPEVFHPAALEERLTLREKFADELDINPAARWIVFVGRLDTQKNPGLLLDAFARLGLEGAGAPVLLLVGDGVLRSALEQQAAAAGITPRLRFMGLRPQAEIARLLQAADLFAMASAYEGMPMALLEALGCGTPAITTDVGEVRRVLRPGVNGMVVRSHDAQDFADELARALVGAPDWRQAALDAVADYQPAQVLAPVYQNYLSLGRGAARARRAAEEQAEDIGRARRRDSVIGVPIDVMRGSKVVAQILRWARDRESRSVCFCNVHSAVLAVRDGNHRTALASADLVVPDGAPVAWTLRRKGHAKQDRVDGPGTMLKVCAAARDQGVKIGLFGSTHEVLTRLQNELERMFPGLRISYVHSPPFRQATPDEDARIFREVEAAGVGLLLVGLGCPKQERWMAERKGRIRAVMLGLGAAFDFHSGTVARAPAWMRSGGLEWLHRLASDPRRLAGRYLVSNSLFLAYSLRDALTSRPAPAVDAAQPRPIRFEASSLRPARQADPARQETTMSPAAALDPRAVDDLVARIDADMPAHRSRVVGFLASSSGEGTTTLAAAYARANAEAMGRSVLLLSTAQPPDDRLSVIEAIRDGQRITEALIKRGPSLTEACLGVGASGDARRNAAWNLLASAELWRALRDSFELVVVDMKAVDRSDAGLKVAPLCDGVVVVLEAARTRAPVVTQLLANLNAVHARVLGTVLNKRQFHLPARLYRWL
jgi:exopolysaccharide biosynthesis WecB/TagA/CpsF family protein